MRKKKAEGADAQEATLDQAAAQASSKAAAAAASPRTDGRLTPLDIQQVEFRRKTRGYDEREVDEFLDRLTEDFAAAVEENQRLRQRTDSGLGAVGAADPAAASRQADEIVHRARADAARIIREAETRAGSIASGAGAVASGDPGAISAFIAKERVFLQQLASLVQDHAEGVKQMVRSSSAAAPPRATSAAPASSPAEPAPSSAAPASVGGPAPVPPTSPAAESARKTPPAAAPKPEPERSTPSPAKTQPTEAMEPVVDERPRDRPAPPTSPSPDDSEPISVPEPEPKPRPAIARSAPSDEGTPSDDERSLRELFWGDE
ncbi:MAG: DivIVA domain-containing protein [Actinomycetota bacterium]